jgi:hypothetical protein
LQHPQLAMQKNNNNTSMSATELVKSTFGFASAPIVPQLHSNPSITSTSTYSGFIFVKMAVNSSIFSFNFSSCDLLSILFVIILSI